MAQSHTSTPSTNCLHQSSLSDVYSPAEDSFLFLDALEKDISFIKSTLRPFFAIEVGSGSGIISTYLSKLVDDLCFFLCIDVSEQACLATKMVYIENGSKYPCDVVRGDLLLSLRHVQNGVADVLLFNPPYVPTEDSELHDAGTSLAAAWSGGLKGRRVIDRFINQITPVLSRSGVLYILLLRENEPDEVSQLIAKVSGGRFTKAVCLAQRKCLNELLFVYRYYDPAFYRDAQ